MLDSAIAILAAGCSSRMGTPKQLLPWNGRPLIRHAAETALASSCGRVIVVLGSEADLIRQALDGLPVQIAINAEWPSGMGTSIHAGVRAAGDVDGLVLALADQPLITPDIYDRLVATHLATRLPIVASQYAGTVGVPVFFAREFFSRLLALPPDRGCKGLIVSNAAKTIRLACPEAEADIDTPTDFERVTQAYRE